MTTRRQGHKKRLQQQQDITPTDKLNTPDPSKDSDGEADTDLDKDHNPTTMEYDPLEDSSAVEMVDEINDEITDEPKTTPTETPTEIVGHKWKDGELRLKVRWPTEETTYERVRDSKLDYPRLTAKYIVKNEVKRGDRDRNYSWATKTVRDLERAVRRLKRMYDLELNEQDAVKLV